MPIEKDKPSIISIKISEENQFTDRSKLIEKLINKLNKFNKKKTSSIKIFNLQLVNEKIVEEQPNPEYESWLEKKNMLESIPVTNSNQEKDNTPNDN